MVVRLTPRTIGRLLWAIGLVGMAVVSTSATSPASPDVGAANRPTCKAYWSGYMADPPCSIPPAPSLRFTSP